MYLLIFIFILPFLSVIFVLKRSERVAIEKRAVTKREEAHIDEEMIIHQALERAGALPNHHHREEKLHQKNEKEASIYYQNLLYTLGYLIIAVEIWYLYISISRLIGT